jgi:hypothetical protein
MVQRNTSIRGLQIKDKAVTVDQMADMGATGHIFVGSTGLRPVSVAVSGDVTISSTGVTDIAANAVTTAEIGCTGGDSGKVLTSTGANTVVWAAADTNGVLDSDISVLVTDVGVGGQTDFVIAGCVENSIQVFLNGMLQEKGTGKDYTVASNTVSLVVPAEEGDIVIIHYIATP